MASLPPRPRQKRWLTYRCFLPLALASRRTQDPRAFGSAPTIGAALSGFFLRNSPEINDAGAQIGHVRILRCSVEALLARFRRCLRQDLQNVESLTHRGREVPFDWSKVIGKVLTIHSQGCRPQNAYVAVEYRGWWFYIADDDDSSKATFTLLSILYALQQATGEGKSPVLTLPIGR